LRSLIGVDAVLESRHDRRRGHGLTADVQRGVLNEELLDAGEQCLIGGDLVAPLFYLGAHGELLS
jgi:hypothetical protein